MDFLALLFAGSLNRRHGSLFRLVVAAAFGSAATVLLFLFLHLFFLYQILLHVLIHPLTLLIAWKKTSLFEFFRDYVTVYLLMWLLGGVMNWGLSLSGGMGFWIWAIAGCGGIAVGIRLLEARRSEKQVYEVLLQTSERSLHLKGFRDTGNLLTDPLGNRPVHIMQEDLLSKELSQNKLSIRLIPYRSLGQEHGLLPVVTLNGMYVRSQKREKREMETPIYIERPVLGLTKEELFQKKEYQIILNAKSF